MIPSKIENVFIEITLNFEGIIQHLVAGKLIFDEFTTGNSIFTICPFLHGTLEALPLKESFLMEGMLIITKKQEYNVDVELFKSDDQITVLIHDRTNVYAYVTKLNQNRNDLFFVKRELSEKNNELAILRRASDKANEEKSRFLAIMSHEVRNPLNTILGYTEMIYEENLSVKVQEYVNYLSLAGKNLKVIVDDILDLSRIEAGKLELAIEEMNINEIVKSNFINYNYQNKNEQVALKLTTPKNIPEIVLGDSVRINQILSNLISNALKFTEKGSVLIQTEIISESKNSAEIRFIIEDTGRGMSPEQTVKIFEEYGQTELNDNRIIGGAGLGLSIVKRLIEAMNGTISVNSELHKGTTFSVEIPFKKALKTKISAKDEVLISSEVNLKGKRILLADDDVLNQKITSHYLFREQLIVTTVANGLEALKMINEQDFDAIILDINMPKITGEQLIQQKSNFHKNKTTSCIALTGNASEENRENYLKLGFASVIFKPYKADELIEVLKAFI